MSSRIAVDAAGKPRTAYAAGTVLWHGNDLTAGGAVKLGDGAKKGELTPIYAAAADLTANTNSTITGDASLPTETVLRVISQDLRKGPDYCLLPSDVTISSRISTVTERLMMGESLTDDDILSAIGFLPTGAWSTIGEDVSLAVDDDGSGDRDATTVRAAARGSRLYVVAAGMGARRGEVDVTDVEECARLAADLTGGDVVTAMVLDGGSRIVVAVRMPASANGRVHHVCLVDSYDGSTPFYLQSVEWQPVCNNTTPGFADALAALRHTAEIGERVSVMRDAVAKVSAGQALSDDRVERMLAETLSFELMTDVCAPVPDHEGKGSATKADVKRAALEVCRTEYVEAAHIGTAWGAYSAVDAWAHWERPVRGDTDRLNRIVNETLQLPADDIRRPARAVALCAAGIGSAVTDVDLAAIGRIHVRSRAGSGDAATTRKSALAEIGRDVLDRFGLSLVDRDRSVMVTVPDDVSSLTGGTVPDDAPPAVDDMAAEVARQAAADLLGAVLDYNAATAPGAANGPVRDAKGHFVKRSK